MSRLIMVKPQATCSLDAGADMGSGNALVILYA